MIRTLLATTALTGLLTLGAYAQDNTNATTNTNAAATTNMSSVTLETGYTQKAEDHLASRIIGMPVYSSAQPDAEQIGDINDLVVDNQGRVTAAVIGVGGFLGIGEKQVAVGYDQIKWQAVNLSAGTASAPAANANATTAAPAADANAATTAPAADANANANADANMAPAADAANTEWRLVVNTTKDALNAAPEFKWDDTMNRPLVTPGQDNAAMNAQPGANADVQAAEASNMSSDTSQQNNMSSDASAQNNNMSSDSSASTGNNANMSATTSMDRSKMTAVDVASMSAQDLIGTRVIGPNDQDVGEVGDVILSADGKVDAVIVDVGGFLGLGEKPVALALDNLKFQRDQNGGLYVWVNFTEDQLKNQPKYDPNTYEQNRDQQRLVSQPMK